MEPHVTIRLKLTDDDDSFDLEKVPLTLDELFSAVYNKTGAVKFKVLSKGTPVKSLEDLYTAYLENREPVLLFEIDEDLSAAGYMASSVEHMYRQKPSDSKLQIQDGKISEQDLLMIIDEMTETTKKKLVESNNEYLARRQEVYNKDEQRWTEICLEQLQFQERLLMNITAEICSKHGINPEVFQNSCRGHASKPSVGRALEQMAEKTLQAGVALREDFTKEKLREVLEYICDYLVNHLREHPPRSPVDFVLTKMREGDEVYRQFGYDENQIATALSTYGVEKEPEWEDIRNKLNSVMTQAMGFDPSVLMGGGFN